MTTHRRPLLLAPLLLSACAGPEPEIANWCLVPPNEAAAPVFEPDGRLIYELYVRSFQDSDGDGVGDLAGVRARLDHIASLGVGTIWLMPIFESPSAAGYNPESFEEVESDYGARADLDALIEAAAAHDIRVIYDVTINHTSNTHDWFLRAMADPDDEDANRRYLISKYQWDDVRWIPTEDGRYYYAFFGDDHPDLDWTDPVVAAYVRDMLGDWLGQGAGGFRVDAVVQLIEEDGDVANTLGSHCAMAWLFAELKREHPDALILSEAWHKAVSGNLVWLGSPEAPEADLVIDVPRRFALLDALGQGKPDPLALVLDQQIASNLGARFAPYLSSHDVTRLASALEEEAARRMAMVFHLLGHGQPILYYGDEIDLPDNAEGDGQDYAQRGPMPWDDTYNAGFTSGTPWFSVDSRYLDGLNVAAQDQDPDSMLSLVRALVALREASDAVRLGSPARVETDQPSTLALLRREDNEAVIILLNLSADAIPGPILTPPIGLSDLTDLTGGAITTSGSGIQVQDLPAYGYRVLVTEDLADQELPAAR